MSADMDALTQAADQFFALWERLTAEGRGGDAADVFDAAYDVGYLLNSLSPYEGLGSAWWARIEPSVRRTSSVYDSINRTETELMETLYWCAKNPGLINCEKHMWMSDVDKVTAAERREFIAAGFPAACEECEAGA